MVYGGLKIALTTELAGMIEELDANEFDSKGLDELKTLLDGN